MLADFNKTFKEENDTQFIAPPELIKIMNDALPEGLIYKTNKDGDCIIDSTNGKLKIEGLKYMLTKKDKEILGKEYTTQDIFDYLYNAQKSIRLDFKKEDTVVINGKEISVDKIILNPMLNNIQKSSGSFYLRPPKFPKPFEIKLGCNEYTRNYLLTRVPNDSVSVRKYKTNAEEPLTIIFYSDAKKHNIKINISLQLEKSKTIKDVVESIYIYNAFVDAKVRFNNKIIDFASKPQDIKKYDIRYLAFWEKC